LLEADATLSLHIETLEARFAFRTRMLDNLWCGVPAIVTAGDVFADIVSEEEIGIAVPAGDTAAIADAILRVLDREYARTLRENLAGAAERYTWERVSGPLLDYCRAPWKLDARREDPASAYLHHIERQYTETVAYARHLESTIAEKDRAIAALTTGRRLDLGRLLPGRHRG
jgi:glycosyltransferase involved in cell wall biosynthesis